MTDAPELAVRKDGGTEPFIPEAAAYFWERSNNIERTISDDGSTITVKGTDADENVVVLEYELSSVVIEVAEYDVPDEEVGPTTPPADTEYVSVYPNAESEQDLILDDEPASFPEAATKLWDQSMLTTPESDFISLTGLDNAEDPIANSYDCTFILERSYYEGQEDDPFFVREA